MGNLLRGSRQNGPPGYGTMPSSPHMAGTGMPPPEVMQKASADCNKDLKLTLPVHYHARHGHEGGMGVKRHVPDKSHFFFEKSRINGPILFKAIVCFLVPPLIFAYTTVFLTFYTHFAHPSRVWPIVMLAIIPVLLAARATIRANQMGLDARWPMASMILFAVAFVAGILMGDMNYLVNLKNYYFVNSLKSYPSVNPMETTGIQLIDAGRVQFAEGTMLKADMGMSFTMWDSYCVAPIVGAGSSNKNGPSAASYDFWAVGKNCCSSDNPTFSCGDYNNPDARSGLRQTNEESRAYYALAVQQAEAAYGITAKNPIFFHWVQDADATMQAYFTKGFRAWIFAIFVHMTANAFVVVILMNMFKWSTRALFHEGRLPGHYMLHHQQ